ncbi:TPA: hypothetical protein HA317_00575 [Candidatus Woesearchaeota archaeon]|nr:hypothetical protein [Candidatus Woesearchaeota archaeon]
MDAPDLDIDVKNVSGRPYDTKQLSNIKLKLIELNEDGSPTGKEKTISGNSQGIDADVGAGNYKIEVMADGTAKYSITTRIGKDGLSKLVPLFYNLMQRLRTVEGPEVEVWASQIPECYFNDGRKFYDEIFSGHDFALVDFSRVNSTFASGVKSNIASLEDVFWREYAGDRNPNEMILYVEEGPSSEKKPTAVPYIWRIILSNEGDMAYEMMSYLGAVSNIDFGVWGGLHPYICAVDVHLPDVERYAFEVTKNISKLKAKTALDAYFR